MKNIIFLLLIGILFLQINSQRCGTDLIKKSPKILDISHIEEEYKKRKLVDLLVPIKIKVDMEYLINQKLMDTSTINKLKGIFDEITEAFSSLLSTYRVALAEDYSNDIKNYCGVDLMEDETKKGFLKYDILIFPKIDQTLDKNILAAASPCLISKDKYKPMAGIVLINHYLGIQEDFDYYMKNLLLHELTHVLGFYPDILKSLNLITTKEVNNQIFTYINSPKVIEKAKLHFGCDYIEGIQLENQGGTGSVGSHWESRYMLGDYMISFDYSDVVISDITLALLEDTGLYKANYYTGGLFRYGKNQGCAFLRKKCVYDKGSNTSFANEFCLKSGEAFCSSNHLSKGSCYIVQYKNSLEKKYRHYEDPTIGGLINVDYCPVSNMFSSDLDNNYYYPKSCKYGKSESSYDVIGSNSICFESSLFASNKKSICYQMNCDKVNKKININIGDNTISCPGQEIILNNPEGLNGEIKCPDYNMVCTSDIWCDDLFDCINKKSTVDEKTYDYISNKEALLERDENNLKIKDDDLKGNFLNINKIFLLISFVLF